MTDRNTDEATGDALRSLGDGGPLVSRLGLGLAAVGRPGYITLGRERDLPGDRSPDALYRRCAELLDAAVEIGVRYFDVARSYGRAEEFLARWLASRADGAASLVVGSKWGYEYTAGWSVDAAVHEEKEHSLARFRRQLEESRALLGDRIDLYQIHSATLESGVLDADAVLAAMVAARRDGLVGALGVTVTGAGAASTLARAMSAQVDGERVFDVVQATCNILEPSLAPLLAEARQRGMGVIVKEVHANGRLTPANQRPEDGALTARLERLAGERGTGIDQLAIAFATTMPFVDVVNSGAATVAQLQSHAAAPTALDDEALRELAALAESPQEYWGKRAALPWH